MMNKIHYMYTMGLSPCVGLVLWCPVMCAVGHFDNPDNIPQCEIPSLRLLYAEETAPLDLLPIAAIPNLVMLNLNGCGLGDIEALAGATGLTSFNIDTNGLADIDAVAGMVDGCSDLVLTGNPLTEEAVDVQTPELCALNNGVVWDTGECMPDVFQCGGADP